MAGAEINLKNDRSRIRPDDDASSYYDLAIVGGGIVGAGIARDAALRGLRVALFEKKDYGSGTTAGSTRLVHGGLRYLEMLDFGLVRMDLRERETLLRIAPHLVRPLEFLLPLYDASLWSRLRIRAGMLLYDLLSYDKSLPGHRYLAAQRLRDEEPELRGEGLRGAAAYYDAQVPSPERLCLENILEAAELGAHTRNYTEVVGLLCEGEAVAGVRILDTVSGEESSVRASCVVNASGPWLDRLASTLLPDWKPRIRTTKGIHLACAPVNRNALVLFSHLDGRMFFVIPWLGYSWVGTTDTDFRRDPGEVGADAEDIRYLQASAAHYFPRLGREEIFFTNAGVRALLHEEGKESEVSRQHRLLDGEGFGVPGFVSVLGGKITGYRAIAEEVTDLACRKLQRYAPCRTAALPLPGARPAADHGGAYGGLGSETWGHLRDLYGNRAAAVLKFCRNNPELCHALDRESPDIAAQVDFAVREEQCVRALDFIARRTLLGFRPDQGRRAFPRVVARMSALLDWSPARKQQEQEIYERWLGLTSAHPERAPVLAEPVLH